MTMDTQSQTSGEPPSTGYRRRLLAAMLAVVPDLGWTEATFDRAAGEAGLSRGEALLAAPNGAADLIAAMGQEAAEATRAQLVTAPLTGLKIREKVTRGVKAYLAQLSRHKSAVTRAVGSPLNLVAGPKNLWAAADAIWAGLGDTSTDANWYTKRMTLSAVVGSTLLVWLNAKDEGEVDAFLARRIDNVMSFEKAKAQAKDFAARFPNPLDLLGKRMG